MPDGWQSLIAEPRPMSKYEEKLRAIEPALKAWRTCTTWFAIPYISSTLVIRDRSTKASKPAQVWQLGLDLARVLSSWPMDGRQNDLPLHGRSVSDFGMSEDRRLGNQHDLEGFGETLRNSRKAFDHRASAEHARCQDRNEQNLTCSDVEWLLVSGLTLRTN